MTYVLKPASMFDDPLVPNPGKTRYAKLKDALAAMHEWLDAHLDSPYCNDSELALAIRDTKKPTPLGNLPGAVVRKASLVDNEGGQNDVITFYTLQDHTTRRIGGTYSTEDEAIEAAEKIGGTMTYVIEHLTRPVRQIERYDIPDQTITEPPASRIPSLFWQGCR